MKKVILSLFLITSLIFIAGCQNNDEKYEECVSTCCSSEFQHYKNGSCYIGDTSVGIDKTCKNICIQKYK